MDLGNILSDRFPRWNKGAVSGHLQYEKQFLADEYFPGRRDLFIYCGKEVCMILQYELFSVSVLLGKILTRPFVGYY